MADATGVTVSVRLGANAVDRTTGELTDCEFAASGTTITFPGYRAVYVASTEETGEDAAEQEALLPPLTAGDLVPIASIEPNGHTTSPPARYTEASLVKRLEELGIGRPSTWASIIQTIQDRGYVWKKGQALVPTWTAFAVIRLLEEHFDALVDYDFTASIDADLDEIARGARAKDKWLKRFYFGDTGDGDTQPISAEAGFGEDALRGLKRLVEENLDEIDAAEINTFPLGPDEHGELIVVKPGKYGPYVKRGEDTASVPDDLTPDELTVAKAIELLALPKSDEPIGELDGLPVFAKNGRYGPYVQWGTHDDPPPGLEKPKMSSLFKTMVLERVTMDDAEALLQLPRELGVDPADGVDDPREQRPLRAVRAEGEGLPQHRLRGPAAADHARRGAADLQPAEGLQARWRQPGGQGPAARVRHRPGQREGGRRQGRPFRRVRHRRRDQRIARQGRPARGDGARARPTSCSPSAVTPHRPGRTQEARRQEDTGEEEGNGQEEGSREEGPREDRRAKAATAPVITDLADQ